jgi:hypothetical protein
VSGHLPECDFPADPRCICDRLRAAERRVLDKARDAVAEIVRARALDVGCECDGCGCVNESDEVAAINALRGGR